MISHSKPWILESDREAVAAVLDSGFIDQGQQVKYFESAVAEYIGVRGGVAVASGTAALVLALKSLGTLPGDEVIMPTYVCHNVADAIMQVGATPIFCDIGSSWNMTIETTLPHVSSKTKAIILVHIFGIPVDTLPFKSLKLLIIEDCCQAFGAQLAQERVGATGDIGIFSFQATKCLTTGEGGMVTTKREEMLSTLYRLRANNSVSAPMTDMQGALGLSQLSRYALALERRKKLAEQYMIGLSDNLTEKISQVNKSSIFFRFLLTSKCNFEQAQQAFEEEGIHIRHGVDSLLHRQFGLPDKDFPNARNLFDTTISLPIYPSLSDDEQEKVIRVCKWVLPR